MASKDNEFTEAGKVGKKIGESIKSGAKRVSGWAGAAYRGVEDAIREYGQEPLLNLYPQAVNVQNALIEAGAGTVGRPLNLGRFPYYDIPTIYDETRKPAGEETPTITVSKKRKPAEEKQADESIRIWRVLRKGEDPEKGNYFETKEAAEAELKRLGGAAVGAVAGIKFPGKTREESVKMRDQYLARLTESKGEATTGTEEGVLRGKLSALGATPEQQNRYIENLKRLRGEREARETQYKAGREKFFTDVKAKRSAVEQVNVYNRQLGLLRNAYNSARKAGDNLAAFSIGEILEEYQRGVPREAGAKLKAAESGQMAANAQRIAEKIKREREERDRIEKLSRANPDAQQFQESSFQPISLTYQ